MIVIVSLAIVFLASRFVSTDLSMIHGRTDYGAQEARILSITERTTTASQIAGADGSDVMIIFEAELLTGMAKGDVVTAAQIVSVFSSSNMKEIEIGDKIIMLENLDMESNIDWMFSEYVRVDGVWILAFLFGISIIIFGRTKGWNALLSLALTCYAIFAVLVPAIISGKDIYFWATLVCIYILLMTILVLNGINRKSFAAILGCAGGVILTGALTHFMTITLGLTGLVDEEAMYLQHLIPNNPINLKAIIFASITIGALGAIMDVAVSLASSLHEISQTAENPTPIVLMKSGFNIGKDMMGTMANTLVLAYIGGSLTVTLLLVAYNSSTILLFNNEMIIVELLQAIVGSFGILFSIPLTTIICSFIYKKPKENNQ